MGQKRDSGNVDFIYSGCRFSPTPGSVATKNIVSASVSLKYLNPLGVAFPQIDKPPVPSNAKE